MSQRKLQDNGIENIKTHVAIQFFAAIFEEQDWILFRPIETWIEGERKRNQPIYAHTRHVRASEAQVTSELDRQLRVSAAEKANVFFGACARFGEDEQFDQAWQIRTVRCLWADIDHSTVEDVLARISAADLPAPSIVVNSGNGVHVYWLLDEPYLIDDAGDPTPVKKEWTKRTDGGKRLRRYVLAPETEERLYLDIPANRPVLSAKAVRIQDILAGVAAASGPPDPS